jgi:predicted type IV restriction endonuclease
MQLETSLRELSARIAEQHEGVQTVQTEEATKRTFVLPFLAALGYNVYDPTQVTWGLGAGAQKGQGNTVDYTVWSDGQPIMVIECKHHDAELAAEQPSHLAYAFGSTGAKVGVFTNGLVYQFYTDQERAGVMDADPFWTYDVLQGGDEEIEQLKSFARTGFDRNHVVHGARELAYTRGIRRVLQEQMQQPSDEFLQLVAAHVYAGRMTHAVKEQLARLTQQAFAQLVNEQISDRLSTAPGRALLSRTL